MLTRLKRPSIVKQLGIMVLLLAFQGYLGFNAVSGQYGIESRRNLIDEIGDLKAKSARLETDIDAYHHRISLFDPAKLDPDILTERAEALLSMIDKNDVIIMKPGSSNE